MDKNISPGLSIVIPVLNEADNIAELITRIDVAAFKLKIPFELIFIDDHSSDRTYDIIKSYQRYHTIVLEKKIGKPGKAHSILQGVKKANYDTILLIDADLQYPPESIPLMYKKFQEGADVVIAHRVFFHPNAVRKLLSRGFQFIFGKLLHGLTYDIQSGMKLFRKEIMERISLKPTPWTFDLEFILKAKDAGYRIDEVEIVFNKRRTGDEKINLFQATMEIGLSALHLKFKQREIIPLHPRRVAEKGKGFHFRGKEFIPFSELEMRESAFHVLSTVQRHALINMGILFVIGLIINWHATVIWTVGVLTFLYFCDLFFNIFLIFRSFLKNPELTVSNQELSVPRKEWPRYTVFCPLYKEWHVLPQFIDSMKKLDYPEARLQVMLLLEEDDTETLRHARTMNLPENFEIVVVPHTYPKTKPKACNYGLTYATGEYIVIYDAEDVPDPQQLKKAVLAFEKSSKKLICVQAKLNFYNPHHNLLTRIFTAEYSLWFDLVLTGLQTITAPIPLGGTSNHFRKKDLILLKGWDSFNVTEDCDLGVRLAKRGYFTAVMDSVTLEEANSDVINWFWQRTRWLKGYLQTYLVHMRDPKDFFRQKQPLHALAFQIVVGEKVFTMLINPLMWLLTIAYFAKRTEWGPFIETLFPGPVLYMGVFCLIVGNFMALYYYMVGCAKRGYDDLIKFAYVVPFYWLLMSAAAYVAVYKLIREPHFWSKTKHGLHLTNKKAVEQTHSMIGRAYALK